MIWTGTCTGLALWAIYRLYRRSRRPRSFKGRRLWALTLARPMVDRIGMGGFTSPIAESLNDDARAWLRSPLLHQLGLHGDSTEAAIRAHLDDHYESSWFRLDLDALLPSDDPHAAIAFACVRTAFLARTLMMLQWIEPMAAWRVLLLNAQRAQECFDDWETFGHAYMVGRRQWIAAMRADPFGKLFNEATLNELLASGKGGWSSTAWSDVGAFEPSTLRR